MVMVAAKVPYAKAAALAGAPRMSLRCSALQSLAAPSHSMTISARAARIQTRPLVLRRSAVGACSASSTGSVPAAVGAAGSRACADTRAMTTPRADGSKLGRTAYAHVGPATLLHTLVTDITAPADEVTALEGTGAVVKAV